MDDTYLRALIADTRDMQRDYQTTARRQEWTDADIGELMSDNNPEVQRLARQGRVSVMLATAKPAEASDIDRLARMAAEDSP